MSHVALVADTNLLQSHNFKSFVLRFILRFAVYVTTNSRASLMVGRHGGSSEVINGSTFQLDTEVTFSLTIRNCRTGEEHKTIQDNFLLSLR